MTTGRVRTLILMAVAVVVLAVGETFLSRGMKDSAKVEGPWARQVLAIASDGWIWAGVALLGLHLGLYMLALRGADLSFALPLTAGSYPIATLLARFYLHEAVSPTRWIGTLLITLGVAIVAV